MQGKNRSRRGTGHLYQKDDRWYGQWYVRGTRVKRSLGPVRQPGTTDGLTKRQAQARMLEAMTETDSAPAPVTEQLTVEEVGKRRIRELAQGPQAGHDARQLRVGDPLPLRAALRTGADRRGH